MRVGCCYDKGLCSVHLQYEGLIFSKSPSSDNYTKSIRWKTLIYCDVTIINIEKILKVQLNHEDAGFVDI